jgi:5'(3')-deoxyribonucleotidase
MINFNFKLWLGEAMEYQHENFTQFLRKFKNRLTRLEMLLSKDKFEKLKKDLSTFQRNGENQCYSRVEYWSDAAYYLLERIEYRLRSRQALGISFEADYVLTQKWYEIKDRLEKYGTLFIGLKDLLKFDLDQDPHYKEQYELLKEMMNDPEMLRSMIADCTPLIAQVVEDMEGVLSNVFKFIDLIKSFDREMRIWAESNERKEAGMMAKQPIDKQIPAHEPFEYMYHATSNLPAIMRDGFKTRTELGSPTGLGGGPSHLISFTSNPKIAKGIASSLKTAVRIAKGDMTFDDVAQKYKKLGIIDDKDINISKRQYNDPFKNTFYLFRLVLGNIQEKGLGYNPFFAFANFESFKKTNINDIGILKAKIDMSKVEEYNEAEAEYRVPVDAISEISVMR